MEQIILNNSDEKLLLLTKNHHNYSNYDGIIELLQLFYYDHYGIDPHEYYYTFAKVMFRRMFNLYMKVRNWKGDENEDILEVFNVAFGLSKTFVRNQDEPIERAIAELFGSLQCISCKDIDENGNWVDRIRLNPNAPDKIDFIT